MLNIFFICSRHMSPGADKACVHNEAKGMIVFMARCVIFCAGEQGDIDFALHADDYIVCCDAGYEAAVKMGVVPHLILGDFDSYQQPLSTSIETLRFPVQKDDTDSMLAVREGISRGFTEFVLLFSLGNRLDHTLANIQVLAYLEENEAVGILVGPYETVRLLKGGEITLPKREGYSLSILALDKVVGINLEGVAYPLFNATLTPSFPLGFGNHIEADFATIRVEEGRVLIIESKIER